MLVFLWVSLLSYSELSLLFDLTFVSKLLFWTPGLLWRRERRLGALVHWLFTIFRRPGWGSHDCFPAIGHVWLCPAGAATLDGTFFDVVARCFDVMRAG